VRRGARIVRVISAAAPSLRRDAAARTGRLSGLAGFAAGSLSAAIRFALCAALFAIVSLGALAAVSASAQAQVITNVMVSPGTYTAVGQTLTFSFTFSTTRVLNSLSFAANSDDSPDDTVVCPAVAHTFPIPQPNSFTCTATHVTTSGDVSAGFVLETPSFAAVDQNNTPVSGTGNQARATLVVSKANTSTSVSSSGTPTVFGQSVTFTATVTGTGSPTGTVTFMNGGSTIGTGTLSGGLASISTSTLSVASHSITADYNGDANNNTSNSSAVTQVVSKDSTTTSLTSSTNPSVFGQSVTFTATVAAVSPGTGTPTGAVTFKQGGTTLGSGTLSGGSASFTTNALAVGGHSITAVYGGDSNDTTSTSTALTQTVNKDATTTSLTSNANPSVFGQSVTFTATVAAVAPGTGTPTGTVTFKEGGTTLGTGTLSGGVGSFSTTALTVGGHSITAVYGGDSNNTTSTSTVLTQTVSKESTTTTLTSSANPSVPGQSVTFTATVAAVAPGTGTPTGTVTFKEGGTAIGTGTLSGGVATFSTTAMTVGGHSITAAYGGDSNDLASTSTALTQTVSKESTTTTLTSSANPAVFGQPITFTASVTAVAPGTGTPTGTVTFKQGGTTLGTGALSAGSATFTTSTLTVGGHSITAVYGGDSSNLTSTSAALTQTVGKDATNVSLSSSVNPVVVGQSVTLTAVVAVVAPGVGTPTGTVTFKDGATTLGSGTLSSGSTTFTTTTLAVGGHSITAVYNGDANDAGATSSALSQSVSKATPTIAVKSSSNNPNFGTTITLTATTSGGFSPTGTVNFLDGAKVLATVTLSAGHATFSTAALAVGAHSITAAYSGDANNQAAVSPVLTINVNKVGTTTALAASATSSQFSSPITLTATVTGHAPTGTVSFKDGSTVLGTIALSAGRAILTVSNLSVGSHSIVAIYNGDPDNTASSSPPVTIAITRPNPATDPDVQGLVTAQVTAEVNFAQAQTDNVIQRLEALHDDNTPFFTNNLGFGALPDQPPNGAPAFADPEDPLARDPAFVAIDKASRNGAPAPSMGVPPFAIWTAGTIVAGTTNVLGSAPTPNNHFTTEGLTAGVDARFSPDFKAGFAVGFGSDHTDVGTDGTTSDGTNISGTAYASYHPFGSIFVDSLLGYGAATFKSDRFSSLPGVFESGTRSGSEIYGALILTSEQKWDQWRVAPYTRVEFIDATLNPFTEQGDPTWALSYASASMQEISGVVGIRGAYDFETAWGVLSPTLRVEYAHAFNNTLNQVLTYADTPGVNYSFAVAGLGQNTVSGAIGLAARYANGVVAQIEFQYSNAGAAEQAQGLRGSLKIPF